MFASGAKTYRVDTVAAGRYLATESTVYTAWGAVDATNGVIICLCNVETVSSLGSVGVTHLNQEVAARGFASALDDGGRGLDMSAECPRTLCISLYSYLVHW